MTCPNLERDLVASGANKPETGGPNIGDVQPNNRGEAPVVPPMCQVAIARARPRAEAVHAGNALADNAWRSVASQDQRG